MSDDFTLGLNVGMLAAMLVFWMSYRESKAWQKLLDEALEGWRGAVKLLNTRTSAPAELPDAELVIEMLSMIEHEQWTQWAKSIMDNEPISAARKERWESFMVPYEELQEEIKEYDRAWARKIYRMFTPSLLKIKDIESMLAGCYGALDTLDPNSELVGRLEAYFKFKEKKEIA